MLSFLFTLEHGGPAAWLDELYVADAQRGRGVGERLVERRCASRESVAASRWISRSSPATTRRRGSTSGSASGATGGAGCAGPDGRAAQRVPATVRAAASGPRRAQPLDDPARLLLGQLALECGIAASLTLEHVCTTLRTQLLRVLRLRYWDRGDLRGRRHRWRTRRRPCRRRRGSRRTTASSTKPGDNRADVGDQIAPCSLGNGRRERQHRNASVAHDLEQLLVGERLLERGRREIARLVLHAFGQRHARHRGAERTVALLAALRVELGAALDRFPLPPRRAVARRCLTIASTICVPPARRPGRSRCAGRGRRIFSISSSVGWEARESLAQVARRRRE